jgi:HEAT repeat protein
MVGTPVDIRAVLAAVTDSLGDPEAEVRGAAIIGLAATAGSLAGPPQALAASLKDKSAENRESAVRTLAKFRRGLDSWIPSLVDLAEHDQDPAVRATSLQTLKAEIVPSAVTEECVPALIKGLESRDRKVQLAVANLLGRLGPKARDAVPALLRILTDPTGKGDPGPGYERQNLAWAAADALARIVPRSDQVDEVVAGLTGTLRSGDRILQSPAIMVLSRFGPDAAPAIPVLIQLVREARPGDPLDVEREAARTLGVIAPDTPAADEVVTVLLNLLRSDFAPARIAAIEALGHFGTKSAIAIPQISSLRDDQNPTVKQAAERAILLLLDERDAQPQQ